MRAMDPKLVEAARRTLESERERLRVELSEEVEHPRVAHGAQTAAATEVSESQRGQQLREREEQHLVQIEGALKRIEAGTFGLCQTCGKPIAPERLEALPWATRLRRLPRQEAALEAGVEEGLRLPQIQDKTKPGRLAGFHASELGCGGRIRTADLRVMSPTSCRCSTPRREV